jgi:hypothetical protein
LFDSGDHDMLGHRGLCFQLGGQRPGILGGVDELGDGFCFVGWVLVGIPLVAAGDRIYRLRPTVLAIWVGLCSVIVIGLPGLASILTHDFGAQGQMVVALGSNFWEFEGSAFAIAAAATLLYRGLLAEAEVIASKSQRSA